MPYVWKMMIVVFYSLFATSALYAFSDPTRPPPNFRGQTALSPSAFVLSAIISRQNRKIAVINGLQKAVGDEILGETITAIYNDTVQLEGASGKITLFLFGQPIKDAGRFVCKRNLDLCNHTEN